MKRKMLCASVIGMAVLTMVVARSTVSARPPVASAPPEEQIRAVMAVANAELEAMGETIRVGAVEYYTAWAEAGQIVYCNDRIKQMGIRWVPGDLRRSGRYDITWSSDLLDGIATGLTQPETQAELSSAMATWGNARCAEIPLVMWLDPDRDWGFYQFVWALFGGGYGGSAGSIYSDIDITHAGWLPAAFFDWLFGSGASDYVIGVAITLYWSTDIDNNGKFDTAFVEIYYNNKFDWGIGTDWPLDVRTIVLHEAGHALSIDHFGKIFRTEANGKLHFAPRAIMNAGYSGKQQRLKGTDLAAFCSIWAAWPNK